MGFIYIYMQSLDGKSGNKTKERERENKRWTVLLQPAGIDIEKRQRL